MNNQNNNLEPTEELTKQPIQWTTKTIILTIVFGLLILGVSALGGYFLYSYIGQKFFPVTTDNQPVTNQPVVEQPTDETPATELKYHVAWIEPEEIESLEIFKEVCGEWGCWNAEESAKYERIGKFIDGKYKDKEIVLVTVETITMERQGSYYRFVKDGDKLILLQNYSTKLNNDNENTDSLIKSKFTNDSNYVIPELEFPKIIKGNGSNPTMELVVKFFNITKDIDEYNNFYNLTDDLGQMKKAFEVKNFGNVYFFPNGYYSPEKGYSYLKNCFYMQAPDGTIRMYGFKLDFVGENGIPAVTWNDGSQNEIEYDYINRYSESCDLFVIDPEYVDKNNDLQIAGKTSTGDNVYELKDNNHQLLKDIYEKDYMTYEEEKDSYEKFLAERPAFFWIDPFDRIILFQNRKFIPAAEMAKPVIYLYPKETTKVSVQVEPDRGISYSEPAYQNGWVVEAKPSGELTELSSGRQYPYLFWEGYSMNYQVPEKGFVISQKEIHNFLIEKLGKLGLNQQETADFMDFWEPRMQGAPYYFVTFIGNQEMDRLAPLTIEPKPDTVIRILMDFRPLAQPLAVEELKIITPERKGFTVVEWGGILN